MVVVDVERVIIGNGDAAGLRTGFDSRAATVGRSEVACSNCLHRSVPQPLIKMNRVILTSASFTQVGFIRFKRGVVFCADFLRLAKRYPERPLRLDHLINSHIGFSN